MFRHPIRAFAAAALAVAASSAPLAQAAPTTAPAIARPAGVTGLGDWTGDHRADLLAVNKAGDLYLYPFVYTVDNDPTSETYGADEFHLGDGVKVGHGWQSFRWSATVPDLNGDGWSDLLAIRNDGTLWRYHGGKGATFSSGVQVGHGWGSQVEPKTVMADVDGNGLPELIVRRSDDNTLWRYPVVTREGRFGNPVLVGSGWSASIRIATLSQPGPLLRTIDGYAVNDRATRYVLGSTGRFGAQRSVDPGTHVSLYPIYSPGNLDGVGGRDMIFGDAQGGVWASMFDANGNDAGGGQIGSGFGSMVRLF